MEEQVGLWWHRWVTRWADTSYPEAEVSLSEMEMSIGLLFRAAGGDHATRVAQASWTSHAGPRQWLQRLAGTGQRAALPCLDGESLALPSRLAVFEERTLNRQLYVWLAAMAAVFESTGDWIADNRAATARALQRFPGLRGRHATLVQAHLRQRPRWDTLRPAQALAEAAVQAALKGEDHVETLVAAQDVSPVWLWMTAADTSTSAREGRPDETGTRADSAVPRPGSDVRRRTREVQPPDARRALLLPSKVESILTWSEFVKLDRGTDDDPDPDAMAAADDMEKLTVAPSGATTAARIRFDLDLPSAAQDDVQLGPGIHVPEWDWRSRQLRPDYCCLQERMAQPTEGFTPSPGLRVVARQVRRRLEVLRSAPQWRYRQQQGDALDTDAWVRYQVERSSGLSMTESPGVFAQRQRFERSLATLLLADLSLSTDAHATNDARVIDVIRDALYVFGEALHATGDAFEMLGFSSVRRQHVRLQHLKGFAESWNGASKARVGAIRPGYYTRMGAAIRGATQRLAQRPERQRLLLVLTDGKPNDLDIYEGRYGLEDTRHAVQQARAAGLLPFCVTIDEQAHDYMPMLFGAQGYAWVRRPQELVHQLIQVWTGLIR
jgi:nitric oxide reductase NorD protein